MQAKKALFSLCTANVLGALLITPAFAYQAPVVSGNVVAPSSEQPLIPVDSGDGNSDTSTVQQQVTAATAAAQPVDNTNNLPNQVQMLEQQVQTLQGQLEVQSHQLNQMQSTQTAQYQDLSRRINLLAQGKRSEATQALVTANDASTASSPAPAAPNTSVASSAAAASQAASADSSTPAAIDVNPEAPPPRAPTVTSTTKVATTAATASVAASTGNATSDSEQAAYQQAYDKLGKQQYSAAKTGFQAYLKQYPNGTYAGDSHYWLGELDLVTGDETSATHEFTTVTQQFSSSPRVPASLLRLGSIYSAAGKTSQAKEAYNAIIRRFPNSNEATQAAQQLKQLAQS